MPCDVAVTRHSISGGEGRFTKRCDSVSWTRAIFWWAGELFDVAKSTGGGARMETGDSILRHRNVFESGGTHVCREALYRIFLPSTFLALNAQLVVFVSALVMSVQFGQFLFCCSSTQGATRTQPFVKVGSRDPVPYGVGAGAYYMKNVSELQLLSTVWTTVKLNTRKNKNKVKIN